VRCGLDRVCPRSVTSSQGQGVRLDKYQSSITGNKNKRRRRPQSCTGGSTATTAIASQPSTGIIAASACTSIILDHDFEWYDLDAIREVHNSNGNNNSNNNNSDRAIIIGHDFNAGLVFTTERQVLDKGAEVNVVNSSVISGFNDEKKGANRSTQKKADNKNKNNKNGQEFEFDLFFWANNNHNNQIETPVEKEEREFRERMEVLEQEINDSIDNNDLSSSSPNHIVYKNEKVFS